MQGPHGQLTAKDEVAPAAPQPGDASWIDPFMGGHKKEKAAMPPPEDKFVPPPPREYPLQHHEAPDKDKVPKQAPSGIYYGDQKTDVVSTMKPQATSAAKKQRAEAVKTAGTCMLDLYSDLDHTNAIDLLRLQERVDLGGGAGDMEAMQPIVHRRLR